MKYHNIAGSFSGKTDPDTGTAETGQQTDSATNCNSSASTSSKGDSASDSDCGGVDDGLGSCDVAAAGDADTALSAAQVAAGGVVVGVVDAVPLPSLPM